MNQKEAKTNRQVLENYLSSKGYKVYDKFFLCPNPDHDDHTPSANIYESKFGEFYCKCFSCDFHADIFDLMYTIDGIHIKDALQQLGTTPALKMTQEDRTFKTPYDVREFIERDSRLEFVEGYNYYETIIDSKMFVFRYWNTETQQKEFRPVHKIGDTWKLGLPKKLLLYNWWKVAPGLNILIVEGEKCADYFNALEIENWLAVTSASGTGSFEKSNWEILKDNHVYTWRDLDKAGLKYQENVMSRLRKENEDIFLYVCNVENLGLEEHQDIVDYGKRVEEEGLDVKASILFTLSEAKRFRVSNFFEERLGKIITGEYREVDFPRMHNLNFLTQPLIPGSVTMVCGNPGASKSYLISDFCQGWGQAGENYSCLFLEETFAFYQQRALAQIAGRSDLSDLRWIRNNPEEAREYFEEHREALDFMFRNIETTSSKQRTYKSVGKWIAHQVEDKGKRLVIVDPITATTVEQSQWMSDSAFLFEVKEVLEYYGASAIFTIHPRMGSFGKPGLEGMARGLAFSNFTQYILWLMNHETKTSKVRDVFPIHNNRQPRVVDFPHNKTIYVEKCRNGQGYGKTIAIDMDPNTLTFHEGGVILTEEQAEVLQETDF